MMAGQGLKRSLAMQRLTKIGTHIQNYTNRKHGRWWGYIETVGALTKTNTSA